MKAAILVWLIVKNKNLEVTPYMSGKTFFKEKKIKDYFHVGMSQRF